MEANNRGVASLAVTVLHEVRVCDADELAIRRTARTDIVAERATESDEWTLAEGPFRHYHRMLEATDLGDGSWRVHETTTYRVAIPIWGWLFAIPVRQALKARKTDFSYWWAPPDRLDAHTATVLSLLCAIQLVDGYLGTVLTQTLTFAADEFDHGNTAQGYVLGTVRFGVLIALIAVSLADRQGRRRLLLLTGFGSCAFTVVGGLSPNLIFLGGSQVIARGLSTALGILIVIIAAEEMPARSRAWAASVLVLTAGLGSGMAVWVLPLADTSPRGWRAIYLAAGLGILIVRWAGTRLPETQRFLAANHTTSPQAVESRQRRRERLTLLAVSAFLIAMFVAPASGFHNDFLKDERGFSATETTLFTLITSTPAGLGVLVGGYLAETRGRRIVGATGLSLGTLFATAAFFTHGFSLWLLTLLGVIASGVAVPALAVYGPELFGTHDRGRANGLIVTIGVMGSAVGLITVGTISDSLGGELGPALALLAVGPLIVAGLVLTKFPETAGMELEEINPQDAASGDVAPRISPRRGRRHRWVRPHHRRQ